MLDTNLTHVTTDADYKALLDDNENVMICCGRMGPMCLPVYDIMETIGKKYPNVTFRDMDFDTQVALNIRRLPEVRSFNGLPFTVYYKNGKVVKATTSIQNKKQVTTILDQKFGK